MDGGRSRCSPAVVIEKTTNTFLQNRADVFIHLHTHSCYSFLEGLPKPEDLVQSAARYQMPALALTDHTSLTGSITFFRACQGAGIKPLMGLEIDLLLPYRLSPSANAPITGSLVLIARGHAGWKNLCRISSHLLTEKNGVEQVPGAPIPLSLDELAGWSSDLICLTGGSRGALNCLLEHFGEDRDAGELLHHLQDIFGDRLYLELTMQSASDRASIREIARIGQEYGIPLTAANSTYYLLPEQAALQKTVAAIRTIQPAAKLVPRDTAPDSAWFRSPSQMEKLFAAYPQALAATGEIAARCNVDLDLHQQHYPIAPLPPGTTAAQYLRQKAEAGARRLYGDNREDIARRIDHELAVIAERGYEPIFLIAEEMISYAHARGIPSASRGSASSSLVAHCLGITTPDPVGLDLYFERFLNPARSTPPDIDTDFCSRRRDEVIDHLFDTYGSDRVAMVGTVNTFRSRSALSETAKAHGLKPAEVRALVKRLGPTRFGPPMDQITGRGPESPYAVLNQQVDQDARYLTIIRHAEALIGLPHHLSVHAGGVVIAPGPINDYVPTARSGGKGVTITQFDLDDVEACGLIKLDLLGIRGLTVLGDVAESIYSWRRKEFSTPLGVLDSVAQDDLETSTLVSTGRTVGCFQIESPGMRATLKDIHARSPDDLLAALALYRPGPLKGGLRDAFVRRHNRQEPVTQIHPALTGLLKETYGVILYQEHVLRIAHELAGLNLAEADLLRRAMSHVNPGKQMQVLREKFLAGAETHSGIPPETGTRIWEMMAAFAGYGFPKAHAASYAQVAWRSAWCKAHYPAEFIAAVLANWGGYYRQSVYLNEAHRLGYQVRPPHINHARQQFSVSYPYGEPVLYMGLDQVRDLTHRTQERIIRYRPFHSLMEFIQKADPRLQEVENLIQVGAFDGIGTIPDLLNELTAGRPKPGQLSLFAFESPSAEDWSTRQKVSAQQRLLGASLEAHPLELYGGQIRESGAVTTTDAAGLVGEKVRAAGLRQTVYRSQSGEAKDWSAVVTLEDVDGTLDVLLAPDVYRRYRNLLSSSSQPIVVEGVVEREESTGEPVIRAERIWRLG